MVTNENLRSEADAASCSIVTKDGEIQALTAKLDTLRRDSTETEKQLSVVQQQYDRGMSLLTSLQEDLDLARRQEAMLRLRCYFTCKY
jgi:predicted  nucleic acid-binding Zn-ribbon protein